MFWDLIFFIDFRHILEAFWPPKTSLLAPPEPFKIMLKSVLNLDAQKVSSKIAPDALKVPQECV